jgi:hypothetical protein
MFCQYCLDEYLLFKDSCPVCEKSIRRGKITRCCFADTAIEKILEFSAPDYYKEWSSKKEADAYYKSKISNLNI